ncbi:MAG: hypothetical protein ABI488_08970 [Polyangiaceae bacterium]
MRTNDVSVRAVIGLSLGLALALTAPLAAAKGNAASSGSSSKGKKKVLVGAFDGPKSSEARKAVIAALKDDGAYDVGETSAKPGANDKSYAAASNGASAVLVGTVQKSGLVLSVRNGADGALVQDIEVKGDSPTKLRKNINDTLGLNVADAISQSKAASDEPQAEAKPEADQDDKPAPAEDAKPDSAADSSDGLYADAHSPLELEAGLRAIHRSFTWHDTPPDIYPTKGYPAPQTYKLPLGPAVFINGTLYPLAFGSRGPGGNFGITGGYELNIATKSVYNEGLANEGHLTTKANQYFVGLKGRIPVGEHQFGIVAAYGVHVFNLLGDENKPTVPDVWYKFIKLSAEGRFRFDALTIGFHVGTRLVSNTGGLQRDWFPHVKTQVLEAGVQAGYSLHKNLDLIFGLDLTRYAFNFNPVPAMSSPYSTIAGGAVDQYVAASLGLRYSFSSHP